MVIDKEYTINDIDQGASDWIIFNLKQLRMFLEKHSGQQFSEVPGPSTLDQYFKIALTEVQAGSLTENDAASMFGVGFGQYLEEKTDYRWVIFSDKYGTDLAVQNGQNGNIAFPLSSARKRFNDSTAGNFDSIFFALTSSGN